MNCRILVSSLVLSAASVAVAPLPVAAPQEKQYALVSSEGLRLHNVSAEPATLQQKQGLRLTISADAARRLANMTAQQQADVEQLAVIDGVEFTNGVIEAEIAGAPAAGAAEGARGFVGIAFRLHNDLRTLRRVLPPSNQRSRRRSGATKPRTAVRLASGLAVVPSAQGDAVAVRVVRRSPAWRMDQDHASRCVATGRASTSTNSRSRR